MVTGAMYLSHLEVQDISSRDLALRVLKRFRSYQNISQKSQSERENSMQHHRTTLKMY